MQIFPKHKYFGGKIYTKYEGWTSSKKVANSMAKGLRERGYLARVASERGQDKKYYQVYRRKI